MLNARYNVTYWFFAPLFACYLSIPLLSLAAGDRRLLAYLAGLGLALVFAAPFACSLLGVSWNASFAPPPVTGYVVYIIIGYLVSRHAFSRRQLLGVAAAGLVGWLASMLGTLTVSTEEAGLVRTYVGYLNLPIVAQAIGVYAIARCADYGKGPLRVLSGACERIAPLTFGIYLIHMYVIELARAVLPVDVHSMVWRTAGAGAIILVCLAITMVLRRTSWGRRLVP